MRYLVTGSAGFIGMHVCKRLLEAGNLVVGWDNINEYYDPKLKIDRLNQLKKYDGFKFAKVDIAQRIETEYLFRNEHFDVVVHLAAQAGVRHSITDPHAYVDSNLTGFLNVIEGCRHHNVAHLVYASSSSVYGLNTIQPFREDHPVDHPISLYAATKRANELMAHTYSHLYNLPTTGLRFFTVYGPWGRPDMALFLFTKLMLSDKPIDVYNYGRMVRDFTFIDDAVNAIVQVSHIPNSRSDRSTPASLTPSTSIAPFQLFNVGSNRPTPLIEYIEALEVALGIKAKMNTLPLQPGDVLETSASTESIYKYIEYQPKVSILDGVRKFVDWYRSYYNIS